MAKRKHVWHCGECHHDLKVMTKNKGTKYLYCPNCDHFKAYYNPIPLIAGLLGSTAIKTGGVAAISSLAGGKIGSMIAKATDKKEEKIGENITFDNKDIPNNFKANQWYIREALK